MESLKVIIADDSVVYRSQIRAALGALPGLEVVAAASNGRLALEQLSLHSADLLILDLEMPELDGLQTLHEIRARGYTCRVIVFSSASKRGSELALEALRCGASDFVTKPQTGAGHDPATMIRELLGPRIEALTSARPIRSAISLDSPSVEKPQTHSEFPAVLLELFQPQLVVIGSSTGGPTMLERLFSSVHGPLRCPIVIAQHMPPLFTATLAERLQRLSGIPSFEARHDMPLEPALYVAPGDFHLTIHGTPECARLMLDQSPQVNSVRPAVDPLFQSAAEVFKDRCLGLVLTGMGSDGCNGAQAIKAHGGAIVIQDEKSCVVFGMPGSVYQAGAFDRVMTPDGIAIFLREKVCGVNFDSEPRSIRRNANEKANQ